MNLNRTHVTVILGVAQTLAWASSYYLLAVLAKPISQAIDISYSLVFGAFSVALLVVAAIGPVAAGLLILSQATQASHVFIAWAAMRVNTQ